MLLDAALFINQKNIRADDVNELLNNDELILNKFK